MLCLQARVRRSALRRRNHARRPPKASARPSPGDHVRSGRMVQRTRPLLGAEPPLGAITVPCDTIISVRNLPRRSRSVPPGSLIGWFTPSAQDVHLAGIENAANDNGENGVWMLLPDRN